MEGLGLCHRCSGGFAGGCAGSGGCSVVLVHRPGLRIESIDQALNERFKAVEPILNAGFLSEHRTGGQASGRKQGGTQARAQNRV